MISMRRLLCLLGFKVHVLALGVAVLSLGTTEAIYASAHRVSLTGVGRCLATLKHFAPNAFSGNVGIFLAATERLLAYSNIEQSLIREPAAAILGELNELEQTISQTILNSSLAERTLIRASTSHISFLPAYFWILHQAYVGHLVTESNINRKIADQWIVKYFNRTKNELKNHPELLADSSVVENFLWILKTLTNHPEMNHVAFVSLDDVAGIFITHAPHYNERIAQTMSAFYESRTKAVPDKYRSTQPPSHLRALQSRRETPSAAPQMRAKRELTAKLAVPTQTSASGIRATSAAPLAGDNPTVAIQGTSQLPEKERHETLRARAMTTADLARLLREHGFVEVQGSKHRLFRKPGRSGRPIPLSRGRQELRKPIVRQIFREANLVGERNP